MSKNASLDKLRDEYDTQRLLDAVDAFDEIHSIVGGGVCFEQPEIREELLKLHTVASRVINDNEPLSDDPDEDPDGAIILRGGPVEAQPRGSSSKTASAPRPSPCVTESTAIIFPQA